MRLERAQTLGAAIEESPNTDKGTSMRAFVAIQMVTTCHKTDPEACTREKIEPEPEEYVGEARRHQSLIVIVGMLYAVIGIIFAWPTTHVRMWRAGAWVSSAVVYAAHIGYERFRISSAPDRAALRVSAAVAVGALGLAGSALVHSLSVIGSEQHTRRLLMALVAWPMLTGVPAFVVALGASLVLLRFRSKQAPSLGNGSTRVPRF